MQELWWERLLQTLHKHLYCLRFFFGIWRDSERLNEIKACPQFMDGAVLRSRHRPLHRTYNASCHHAHIPVCLSLSLPTITPTGCFSTSLYLSVPTVALKENSLHHKMCRCYCRHWALLGLRCDMWRFLLGRANGVALGACWGSHALAF